MIVAYKVGSFFVLGNNFLRNGTHFTRILKRQRKSETGVFEFTILGEVRRKLNFGQGQLYRLYSIVYARPRILPAVTYLGYLNFDYPLALPINANLRNLRNFADPDY